MRSAEMSKVLFRKDPSNFFCLLLFCGVALFFSHEAFASDPILGKVLELDGVVESSMPGEKAGLLRPGMTLRTGAQLDLRPESWIVLVMADSTVRKFSGPATITMNENLDQERGSVLTRLGSALVGMLFAQEQEGSEVVMATRVPDKTNISETGKSHIPLLVLPAPGSSLLKKPSTFEWRKVEGIPLYRVSVYSWDRLLWQGTTSDAALECPPDRCKFDPGEEYYWVVEGLIGNSALRSRPAKFRILPENARSELSEALTDQGLPIFAKIRLCLSLNLYHKALDLIDSHWGGSPSDPEAYGLRAEIKGMMGLREDAFFDYFMATQMSSGK
ncbi:MAG: hypothetical protein WBC42_09425 [Candidatus Zixiibacteriota bacterium]